MKVEATEVEVVVSTKGITLSLTEEESAMLFAICGNIVGYRNENNVRVLTDKLWEEIPKVFPDFYKNTNYGPMVEKYIDNIDQQMRINSKE